MRMPTEAIGGELVVFLTRIDFSSIYAGSFLSRKPEDLCIHGSLRDRTILPNFKLS